MSVVVHIHQSAVVPVENEMLDSDNRSIEDKQETFMIDEHERQYVLDTMTA